MKALNEEDLDDLKIKPIKYKLFYWLITYIRIFYYKIKYK